MCLIYLKKKAEYNENVTIQMSQVENVNSYIKRNVVNVSNILTLLLMVWKKEKKNI